MKSKIGIFLICMLLIIYITPASGLIEDPRNENLLLTINHIYDDYSPPFPGDMADDFVLREEPYDLPRIVESPDISAQSVEETIIEILQQLDEDLVLGYLEDLVAFGPRVTGTSACQQAGNYIYDEFENMGLDVRFQSWSYGGYSDRNVEATHYGINETSDEIYVVCAHYDSVPGSPGADDDGSGTVAVMAVAYLMSQYDFNYTVRFVTFSGEEQGLLGSHEYVEEAYNNGDNIMGVLNADMIGYAATENQGNNIKIYYNSASQWLYYFTKDVSQEYYDYIKLNLIPSGEAWNSDHASFWQFNYGAIMYHEYQFNPYYHSPQDIIANMNITYCTKSTKLIVATLGELAQACDLSLPPETPTKPDGPEVWTIDLEATFTSTTTDPEGESIYYLFDWGDGTDSGWVGPYGSGQTGEAAHIWTELGEYEIKVKAKDDYDYQSEWSEPATILIVENEPPGKPTISGPKTGSPRKSLKFTFVSTDPEGHDLYYTVHWGDGLYMPYTGPYASGEEITFSHAWSEGGDYTITAKARDGYEAKSPQNSFKLSITKNRAVTNPVLLQLLEKLMDHFPILRQLLNRIY